MKFVNARMLWNCAHAVIALLARVFILVVLALGLLDARSAINGSTTYLLIVLFVVIGHLSGASYLLRRIRDDFRGAAESHS